MMPHLQHLQNEGGHTHSGVSLCLRLTEMAEVSRDAHLDIQQDMHPSLCLDIVGYPQGPLGLSFVCHDTTAKPGHKA